MRRLHERSLSLRLVSADDGHCGSESVSSAAISERLPRVIESVATHHSQAAVDGDGVAGCVFRHVAADFDQDRGVARVLRSATLPSRRDGTRSSPYGTGTPMIYIDPPQVGLIVKIPEWQLPFRAKPTVALRVTRTGVVNVFSGAPWVNIAIKLGLGTLARTLVKLPPSPANVPIATVSV